MKIAYYCQQVLGVGHFHRSLEICRALSTRHNVTMITGGSSLDITEKSVDFFQLPGLMMDREFNNLTPCDSRLSLDDVKHERKKSLFHFFEENKPEIFLVELYPFGRKAFRFELDPVLMGIKNLQLPPCRIYCSLRDILVERSDQEKFEQRIITAINTLFDGLLIHGDQNMTPLDETFSRTADITIPTIYTGYVTPKPTENSRGLVRKKLKLPPDSRLIVASIGGGNVGEELLINMAKTFDQLHDEKLFLQIFTGPYADGDLLNELQKLANKHLQVERFSPQFPDWLAAADLSVSMAGYNTCMNILAAGVPALLYPFNQNQEQLLRVQKLTERVPFTILQRQDLNPAILANLVYSQLNKKRFVSPVNLDGAGNTVKQVEKWHFS
jgi:predicted glycosyltransferase